jgi:choline dehydrogenase-like flavoprotein
MKDVLIIGSGAGGGPLSFALSEAGLDVLVLEKGPRYERSDYVHDELAMNLDSGFFVPKLSEDPHVLVRAGSSAPELTTLGWIGSCVGGGTARMSGYFYRFLPDDFRMCGRFGDFEENADWPYSYEDLEPYYCRAECEIGVSGGYGPLDGPRSVPLPMPSVDCHPLADVLDAACRRLRLSAYPTPRAINSRPYNGRPGCSYCQFCGGYGCPTGARGSTQEALLARAEATDRCEIRPRSMVKEITMGRGAEVTGCVYVDESGHEHEVAARVVCVCCSAVESARLLLMSKSPRFPSGLANGSGLVGRHLQFHSGSTGRGRIRGDRHPNLDLMNPNPHIGRSVMDYYFLPPGVSPLQKGGLLRFGISSPEPISNAIRLATEDPLRVAWGAKLEKRLLDYYRECREVHFEVFQDFIPNDGTYVELDPEVKDRWGLPAARIHLREPEHHQLAGKWLVERGMEVLDAMGADELKIGGVGYTTQVHAHGTCRAGRDPRRSVVDEYCRAHEVPNLFVVDGSFMPTSGGAAPTLTILANSFRTAEHLVVRFRAGDFGP